MHKLTSQTLLNFGVFINEAIVGIHLLDHGLFLCAGFGMWELHKYPMYRFRYHAMIFLDAYTTKSSILVSSQ